MAPHTASWLVRTVYLFLHDSKTFREAKVKAADDDEMFTRFEPFERFLHFLVVTSFLLLVITGMPLKFYYTDWAKALFSVLGGPETARTLHRFGALITFLYFGLHTYKLATVAWTRRAFLRDPATGNFKLRRIWLALSSPDSMVPTIQDWHDFVAHNKWFFGKGPKPQFDRWTYWEKFDYFAVFWGVFIIGLSGLVMWFPLFFTRVPAGLDHQHRAHCPLRRGAAGGGLHFYHSLFQHAFPPGEIPDGHRHFLRAAFPRPKCCTNAGAGTSAWWRAAGWTNIAPAMNGNAGEALPAALGKLFFGLQLILLALIVYAMISRFDALKTQERRGRCIDYAQSGVEMRKYRL